MKRTILTAVLISAAVFCAYAQRSAPIDLVLLLDTSSAMSSSYENVNNYLTGPFLTEFLRVGDTFHLVPFSASPKLDVARRINSVGDVETIIGRILLQYPVEKTSNIGAAITYAEQYISILPSRSKKIVLVSVGGSDTNNLVNASKQRLGTRTTFDYVQITPGSQITNPPVSGRSAPARTTAASTSRQTSSSANTQGTASRGGTGAASSGQTTGAAAGSGTGTASGSAGSTGSITSSGTASATGTAGSGNTGTSSASGTSGTSGGTTTASGGDSRGSSAAGSTTASSGTSAAAGTSSASSSGNDSSSGTGSSSGSGTGSSSTGTAGASSTTGTGSASSGGNESSSGTGSGAGSSQGSSQTAGTSSSGSDSYGDEGTSTSTYSGEENHYVRSRSFASSMPLIIGIIIGILLLLGLIILLASRRLSSSPNRVMRDVSSSGSANGSFKDHSKDLAKYAAGSSARRSTPYDDRKPKTENVKQPVINPAGPLLLNLFVEDQNTSIGKRNIHSLKSGYGLSVGGGKTDDYLIFLVPMPPALAEIRREGASLTFIPKKPKYFPDIGSNQVKDCINKTIRVVSDKNYEMCFRFEMYEDPLIALNRMLMSVKVPG